MQYKSCNSAFFVQVTLVLTQKAFFLAKVRESQRILIMRQKTYVLALNFRRNPNFSIKALRAFAQLLPPYDEFICISFNICVDGIL